ncbi:MAG: TonB-dependent receptor [Opitutales bacterium]
MNTSLLKRATVSLLTLLGVVSLAFGQGVTTSGIEGQVTDASGAPVASANVRVIHEPSGSVSRTVTRNSGYYGVTGLRVGGPFTVTVSAPGYRTTNVEEIYISLSRSQTVDVALESTEQIQELDAFVVTGEDINYTFTPGKAGAGSVLDNEAVEQNPIFRRSINDLARFNPYATITEYNRNELSVAGQNSRFNNVQIDGIRTNDQFGLNSNGVAAFNAPIASDAIEQVSVEVSPYDVWQSGFTGASINAVTKSGTNDLSGSFYTYYFDDGMRGEEFESGDNELFREFTWGATLGGPILKDKLFFFVNYEEFERTTQPGGAGFDPDPAAIQQVIDYGRDVLGVDFGEFAPPSSQIDTEDKILAKLDWNISEAHRASLRYRQTDGVNPNFGNFDDFGETALSTNFYQQERTEEDWVFQLSSTWTPDIQSEFKIAYGTFDQPTTFDQPLPEIEIDAFPGADGDPDAGELFMGTELFRHANSLSWETITASGTVTWYKDDFVITGGFDYEFSEYENLFLFASLGDFTFRNLDDFLNDRPQFDGFRNTGIEGQDPIARPEIGDFGLFLQNKWYVNDRLTLTGGIRADFIFSDTKPPAARGFVREFGFPNNGTIDGENLIAPRFAFNYAIDDDRTMQLRGGIGLFLGRNPAVWFSNAYTNNGETSGSIDIETGLQDFLANDFDPNNPILFIPREESTPAVDVLEDGLELPSVWRYNLAFDYQLPWYDLIFTAEILRTETENALWVENANQPVIGTLADGRALYDDGGASDEFRDVFVLRNTDRGKATNFTLQVEKPQTGLGFFGSFAYTYGSSEDVNPFTSSRAVSNWNNRAGFNFNEPELGTSNFEVRDRFLGVFGYDFEAFEGFRTNVTLVYEGRSGRPFSYVFGSDVNGTGEDDTDLFYMPTGPNDPIVSFAPGFNVDGLFAWADENGVSPGVQQRNAEENPWVHRFDLKVVQEVPVWGDVKAELFFDFLNIGNWLNDEWGLVKEVGFPFTADVVEADVNPDGTYTFTDFDPDSPQVRTGSLQSRWAIQTGFKIKF